MRAFGVIVLLGATLLTSTGTAQQPAPRGATITGRVYVSGTGAPVPSAEVLIEGTGARAVTDSAGRYSLTSAPAGTQTLIVRRIGYAVVRATLTIPDRGTLVHDVAMAENALQLPTVTVTADATARAKGELGTASVIDHDAIANQSASSLRGVLELIPGATLQPPGLGSPQQFSLRTVPTSSAAGFTAGGPTAGDIASFGTSIVLDGVPLSNNANLQSLGPRGELSHLLSSTAGGGIDLRDIPASTIERVEAIRGIPSARYGDLTEGVVVVDTRAGVVPPAFKASTDPNTSELSFVGGQNYGRHGLTITGDVAHTLIQPGLLDDDAWRVTGQLAHHLTFGPADSGGLTLDTRIRFYQTEQNNPVDSASVPGQAATNHDRGLRVLETASVGKPGERRLTLTASVDEVRRQSTAQSFLIRGAEPFTDRLTEGQQVGHFVLGSYLAKIALDGSEWHLYDRLELEQPFAALGFDHVLRLGGELRREWNGGAGYQFDIETPPQVTFNGVEGFDRPRTFDAVPPLVTSAGYLDDRLRASVLGMGLDLQAGLRVDALHDGTSWFSGVRDAAWQPRVNAELAPLPWLRLRAGTGRTAKTPSLDNLYPSPQYFDVVNVNFFANNPADRLAVLTTFMRDPTNAALGFSVGHKSEAGIELASPDGRASLSLVAFRDNTTGAVGFLQQPSFVPRDRFQLDSAPANNPPIVHQPPIGTDTMPILIDRPANLITLNSSGYEATLFLPEFKPLNLTITAQAALTSTEFSQNGPDFGQNFSAFQLNAAIPRAPYWDAIKRDGERGIVTYRVIHHQPRLGLVITATIEHIFKEQETDSASVDTLAFAGYITRAGQLVPVPADQRADPQYADLHTKRSATFSPLSTTTPDWLLSLQVSKTLPLEGELRFYGFNLLDRPGREDNVANQRTFPRLQFGLEITLPLAGILPVGLGGP